MRSQQYHHIILIKKRETSQQQRTTSTIEDDFEADSRRSCGGRGLRRCAAARVGCYDCSCEKEKSLIRSFLSSVLVQRTTLVHSSSIVVWQWRTLFFVQPLCYCSMIVVASTQAPLSLFKLELCSSAIDISATYLCLLDYYSASFNVARWRCGATLTKVCKMHQHHYELPTAQCSCRMGPAH